MDNMHELVAAAVPDDELYQVTRFVAYHRRPDAAAPREVTIEVWDRGPADTSRWHVHVFDQDGRRAVGNPNSDLGTALTLVHWGELDE